VEAVADGQVRICGFGEFDQNPAQAQIQGLGPKKPALSAEAQARRTEKRPSSSKRATGIFRENPPSGTTAAESPG
jgi:hypothetical protein